MNPEKAKYIAYCIRRDFEGNIEDLRGDDIEDLDAEYNSGWRLHESGNGYVNPQGVHIRLI